MEHSLEEKLKAIKMCKRGIHSFTHSFKGDSQFLCLGIAHLNHDLIFTSYIAIRNDQCVIRKVGIDSR